MRVFRRVEHGGIPWSERNVLHEAQWEVRLRISDEHEYVSTAYADAYIAHKRATKGDQLAGLLCDS